MKMGCLNSKHKVTEQTKPYTLKKQSRWRLIVGFEIKGLELNAQVGLVHVGDEKYDKGHTEEELEISNP